MIIMAINATNIKETTSRWLAKIIFIPVHRRRIVERFREVEVLRTVSSWWRALDVRNALTKENNIRQLLRRRYAKIKTFINYNYKKHSWGPPQAWGSASYGNHLMYRPFFNVTGHNWMNANNQISIKWPWKKTKKPFCWKSPKKMLVN